MLTLVVLTLMLLVVLPIFIYWMIIFLIRINNSRKYVRGASRHLTDEDAGYLCAQVYYHYQTEITKYILLFAMAMAELTGSISYYIDFLLENYDQTVKANVCPEMQLQCDFGNDSLVPVFYICEFSKQRLMIVEVIGDVSDMFVAGLGLCLMNYLIGRMKHSETSIMSIKRFVLILTAVGIITILLSFYSFLNFLYKAIFVTALTILYIMFLLEVKKFKQALLQIAIERIAQHGAKTKIEMRQYRYFSYSMNCICIGLFLITLAVIIQFIMYFFIHGLFFADCYFPFNFFSGYVELLSFSEKTMAKLSRILYYIGAIKMTISCIGILFWVFPLVLITVFIWINIIWRKMRGVSTVQFRYQVSSFNSES